MSFRVARRLTGGSGTGQEHAPMRTAAGAPTLSSIPLTLAMESRQYGTFREWRYHTSRSCTASTKGRIPNQSRRTNRKRDGPSGTLATASGFTRTDRGPLAHIRLSSQLAAALSARSSFIWTLRREASTGTTRWLAAQDASLLASKLTTP